MRSEVTKRIIARTTDEQRIEVFKKAKAMSKERIKELEAKKAEIEKLKKQILELHDEKESALSEEYFYKCCDLIYEKEIELMCMGAKTPLGQ